ncbi:MAG: hypothetical protein R3C20_07350 [Planctomycetaceae bacterium]
MRSAETQLATLKTLIDQVNDNVYLAKLAVFARERACMKDMSAALAATLAARDTVLFHQVFDRVIDNGRVADAVPDDSFGPVRQEVSVEFSAAGIPAVVELCFAGKVAVSADRSRSIAPGHPADGSTNASGQRPACSVWLADG